MTAAPIRRSVVRVAIALLTVYGGALALVAFWPTHVDRDAGPLLGRLFGAVSWLPYAAVEWWANVALFLPLGVLGALVAARLVTALAVVPLAGLAVSALIETAQALALPGRTGSLADVVANTLGATIGCLAVALTVGRRRPSPEARAAAAAPRLGPSATGHPSSSPSGMA